MQYPLRINKEANRELGLLAEKKGVSKNTLIKLILLKWAGGITRSEMLMYVSDAELTELEIELYPLYQRVKEFEKEG